jgi:hypothetical protein
LLVSAIEGYREGMRQAGSLDAWADADGNQPSSLVSLGTKHELDDLRDA